MAWAGDAAAYVGLDETHLADALGPASAHADRRLPAPGLVGDTLLVGLMAGVFQGRDEGHGDAAATRRLVAPTDDLAAPGVGVVCGRVVATAAHAGPDVGLAPRRAVPVGLHGVVRPPRGGPSACPETGVPAAGLRVPVVAPFRLKVFHYSVSFIGQTTLRPPYKIEGPRTGERTRRALVI